jgi:hypothetical protein
MRHASGLLAVAGQEVPQALNGFREVPGPRQGDDPQMIRRRALFPGKIVSISAIAAARPA